MLDPHPHPDGRWRVGYCMEKDPELIVRAMRQAWQLRRHQHNTGAVVMPSVRIICQTSTVPSSQNSHSNICVPVLYPATVSEFITFGLHAAALSRYSGCCVALSFSALFARRRANRSVVFSLTASDAAPVYRRRAISLGDRLQFFPVLTVATERRSTLSGSWLRHLRPRNALDRWCFRNSMTASVSWRGQKLL